MADIHNNFYDKWKVKACVASPKFMNDFIAKGISY